MKHKSNEKIKFLKLYMILGFLFIIIGAIVSVSVLALKKTDMALKTQASNMTAALNMQMKMNMDSHISSIESIGTLIYALDDVYLYDATKADQDGYDALATEEKITNKLYDICIMENFVDFGIVYRNNHSVGKLSNGTSKLFKENLFTDLEKYINRARTNDGWGTGYKDDYNRIYYVKKIHENAVFVLSFYTTELEDVFEHPGGIENITVRLVANDDVVIYSSENDEKGNMLPDDILSRLNNNVHSSYSFMDDDYVITANNCCDEWRVICSVPAYVICQEKNEVKYYIIIVGIIASILSAFISVLFSYQISNPVTDIVTTLDAKAHLDMLTGVLNKKSFEEYAESSLAEFDKKYAVVLIDVDNFKGVNDTLGHEYGDKVLANIGNMLHEVFSDDDYLGRIGGDEFCVLLRIPDDKMLNVTDYIQVKCNKLCNKFHDNYTGDDGNYKISASIGVSISREHGDTFSELYKCADKALYRSKHKGKDTYTIYAEVI